MKRIDKQGYVRFTEDSTRTAWEHIRVAEHKLGRPLGKSEQVHHINGDKTDNREENLLILRSNRDHQCIHSKIPYEIFKTSDGSSVVVKKQYTCKNCNRLFEPNKFDNVFCSLTCSIQYRTKRIPEASILAKQIWEMPTSQLAKIYQVSDKAIEKWCKKYGIEKPGRGYWQKKASAK
jgi:hypothetical protein